MAFQRFNVVWKVEIGRRMAGEEQLHAGGDHDRRDEGTGELNWYYLVSAVCPCPQSRAPNERDNRITDINSIRI